MQLLVGLGNPSPNNQDNRHNIGFRIIDAINKRNWPASVEYSKDESVENIKGPWGEA